MSHNITINHITKIEGHATLELKIDKGEVKKAELRVVEGARFFETIIRNRRFDEVNVLTSRICGTCSPSHSITALKAVEDAFGIEVSEQTMLLRELLVLGSIIQNHTTHLYFLALPDYLGYGSAIQMAPHQKDDIKRALSLKHLGNKIVYVVGGREVHPVTNRIGCFSKLPAEDDMKRLLAELKASRSDAIKALSLFSGLHYPKFERMTNYFALRGKSYGFLDGRIHCLNCCGPNVCIPNVDYKDHFREYFQTRSDAEYVTAAGKPYMVGALARLNVNSDLLPKGLIRLVPFKLPNYSPLMNNVAQAFEIVFCIERCIEILESLKLRNEILPKIKPKAARGIGTTEAPRGILFHDYTFDKHGYVKKANLITPTSQNLANIQDDIKLFLPPLLETMPKERIIIEIEKLIRAYDPCISCATHFLRIKGL